MKTRLLLKLILLSLLVLVQASCIKKTSVVPPEQRLLPAKTATREELLQDLQERSKRIESLKAAVAFDFSQGGAKSGVLDEYKQTKGYIFIDRPTHIRMQVQAPIVLTTVAVMVSNGQEYRVSIPIKNQFAVMDVNAPVNPKNLLSNLRPSVFLDGFFVDITSYENRPPLFEEAVIGTHSFYVFSFFDTSGNQPELLEKIWIDRTDLQVVRKQMFGKGGRLEEDVDYQNYHAHEGIPFPEVVVIHRPIEDLTIKITFQQTTVNEKLEAKVFDLPRPEGSELVQFTQ